MRKILMLDVDGVLNSSAWAQHRKLKDYEDYASEEDYDANRGMDPEAVARLNTIVEQTNCEIVISSTWRLLGSDEGPANPGYKHVARMLVLRGFKYPDKIIGCTPDLSTEMLNGSRFFRGVERGHEIQAWLDKNTSEPVNLVIVDDDTDMVHLTDKLVNTFDPEGLQDSYVEEIVRLFNV